LINVVGFAGATGRTVPIAATHIYELSFFTGFGVSSLIYILLNLAFPVPGRYSKFEEVDLSNYTSDQAVDPCDTESVSSSADKKGVSVSIQGYHADNGTASNYVP
jgi:NCS1 family nucleobase:cation symporter-1